MDGENFLLPWREGIKGRGTPIAYHGFTTKNPWSLSGPGVFRSPRAGVSDDVVNTNPVYFRLEPAPEPRKSPQPPFVKGGEGGIIPTDGPEALRDAGRERSLR
jgi:hypothetical protein